MSSSAYSMNMFHKQSTVQFARIMKTAYLNYAVETIKDRALPDVRDGLKPVHRRILYTMQTMSLRSNIKHRKSARIVGETMGKYHPHGDTSIYDAMVRMGQDFAMRIPLVDGQGNFGSIDGDSAAAMRYTEVRMTSLAEKLMSDIESDTVAWQNNFDKTLKEPIYLPARFPNLLVNGSEGIAVGMASKIPPHNLAEICHALIYMAQNWHSLDEITVTDLMEFVQGPDFPTGGIIYQNRDKGNEKVNIVEQLYRTGRGKITMQGVIGGQDSNGNPISKLENARRLVITEIPYGLNKSTLLSQIADGVRNEKIKGISDLRDESDYEGMRIIVTVTRGYKAPDVLAQLLNKTNFRMTYGAINLALVNSEPEYLSLHRILRLFIEHRLDVISKRTKHELAKREKRLHVIEGILTALRNIDKVIDVIRKSRKTDTARRNLMEALKLSEEQAKAILDMRLARLVSMERRKLDIEQKELRKRISFLKGLLESETKQLDIVIEETQEIKNEYATPRLTTILSTEEMDELITKADLLKPKGKQIIIVTNRGMIYRHEAKGFRLTQTVGVTKRAVDAPLFLLRTQADDKILFVSNKGRIWRGPVYRVLDKMTSTEIGLQKGEGIIMADILRPESFLTMVSNNGKVKRIATVDLSGSEVYWSTAMGGLKENDEVIAAGLTADTCKVMLFTKHGKAIKFAEIEVNPQSGGNATGVTAIRLRNGDMPVAGAIVPADESNLSAVIITEQNLVKRTALLSFSTQGRAGQGVQAIKITQKTGNVVAATVAHNDGTVSVFSRKNRRHLLRVADIPSGSRTSQGQKMIDFDMGDTIVRVVAFD